MTKKSSEKIMRHQENEKPAAHDNIVWKTEKISPEIAMDHSRKLLELQQERGLELGKSMEKTLNNPNISPANKEKFAKKCEQIIEDYGNVAQAALVKSVESAEETSYPLVRMIRNAIDQASEAGNKAITEVGKGVAYVAGESVKEVGAGLSIAIREITHRASQGIGRGAGSLLRGIYEGLTGM